MAVRVFSCTTPEMVSYTHSAIANLAWESLNDVPPAISGAVMQDMVDQARLFANSYTRQSIGSNAIDEAYAGPIINLTKAYALGRMAQVGASFNWSLGEFRVDKGAGTNVEATQVQQWYDAAVQELQFIGRKRMIVKVNG